MERVVLGRTGLEISRIGFGAWAAGGTEWFHGWSGQTDEDSLAAIARALDLGVDWIDTAAAYGFGHSEEIVGGALEGLRQRPYVFTKCSVLPGPPGPVRWSLERDSIRAELEGSLHRLRTDRIDLYQIHGPRPPEQIEEGWRTLAELKEEGLVRLIGVSNFTVEQLELIEQIAPVETLQPPYSLLRREAEADLFPYTREHGIGVIVYSPLASGLLTGGMTRERLAALPETDWRHTDSRFAEPMLTRGLELSERAGAIAARHGVTASEVAIAWTLQHPAVHGAIVGFRNAAQVERTIGTTAVTLTRDDVTELEAA
jgi:aryl-alcohol dehydrogenase-like predicted oxidoreductase